MSTEATGDLQIRPMRANEIDAVIALARAIWKRHYPGIITQAQIDYMLGQRYTAARLADELADPDIDWSLAIESGRIIGFSSLLRKRDAGVVKLDKLYVDPDCHRRGIGAALVAAVRAAAIRGGFATVELAVNRHNMSAITAYQRLGFRVREARQTPIGEGFVMDDFIMVAPASLCQPVAERKP